MAGVGYALEQALAYYRAPTLLAMAAQRPLPDDVIELLRLAAGDAAQAAASADASGESPERVTEAAVFFVQQVMFAAGADPHRVLGVNPDAPPARVREHYRWLIRWLHPDRNPDDWDSVYTDRVTRAWQQLRRSGALMGEGDNNSSETAPQADANDDWFAATSVSATPAAVLAAARQARITRENDAAPILSASTARRLPVVVLGGLALAAVSLVALLWYTQQKPARPQLARQDLPSTQIPRLPTLQQPPVGGTSVPIALHPIPAQSFGPEGPPTPAPHPVGGPSGPNPSPTPTATASVPDVALALESFGPEGPPTGVPVAAGEGLDEATAHALLSRFTTAYAAGDINALMRLFTRDARNNRGDRDAIAYDYQWLFTNSRERRLDLQPNGWITSGSGAVVLAGYEAWVKEGRLRAGTTTRGAIRFTLRQENGELKISQVIHD
ncbi:hypothetical protein [Arenimonas alkanexedens]